jgi:hypothetical protein
MQLAPDAIESYPNLSVAVWYGGFEQAVSKLGEMIRWFGLP